MQDNNMELDNPMGTEGIPARILETAKKVGQERRRLYAMIKNINHRVGIGELTENDLVVSIGCGNGLDSLPINSALSGQPFGFIGGIQLVGIDLDQNALKLAQQDNYSGEVKKYIHGDARNLGRLLEGQRPTVVIARHPNIAEKENEWEEIFKETYRTLKDGGTFIVISMQDYERERVKKALEDAGFELAIDEKNAFAGETKTFGSDSIQYDKYIAVGIKNVQSINDTSQSQSAIKKEERAESG